MNIVNNEESVKSENTVNHERYIEVPRGWNRCLENGSIVYFSPSQICLRSKEDIARYLISDRTCKCGLDCPLYIDNVFDFDASLPSRHFKLTKLENDHKTLCRETMKARFATLAQTQTVIKTEVKEGKVNKPVIIKKKSEVSVSKKKNETPKLPSFETFVSLADAKASKNLQGALTEEPKAKKPRRPVSHRKKPNATMTSALPTARSPGMPTCQTVHTNTTPILHSSVEMQTSKDVIPKTLQYPTVSTGALFGTSEHPLHPQNVGSLFTFPSTQLNASSFLASLSSTTTMPSRTRTGEVSHVQTVHPLRPFTTKSTVEHAPFVQKPAVFPCSPNQPNNVVYLSSTGTLHPMPNPNSVNWPGATGIPLSMLPQGNADTTSLEKSKGGFTMKGKESLPKMVYPYPAQLPSAKPMMSTSSVTSKAQLKQHDLAQLVQNQLTKSTITEATLPGHPNTKIPNIDKHNNTRTVTKPPDPLNQPLQYCGILLQPGMVPQVQLAGAGPRPSVGAGNSQEQNPYGNLYTLQGLPYGSNVGNPAVLGMASNTVIPYFLGIAQPNTPKPIVPATISTNTTKESSPTCSTAPVSTSAIAAAYSAFVSIAPASVTTSSFSQQLVNLVSNYNNPYWQHLLTQGGNSNTLAYQLMQIGQYANTRLGSSAQTTKSSGAKSSPQNQTKLSTSSSRSSISSSQESKPKTATKDSVPATSSVVSTASTLTTSCSITTSSVVTNTTVTTAREAKEGKRSDCVTVTSKPSISNTVSVCTSNDTMFASSNDSSEEKSACTIGEPSASTNDISVAKLACTGSDTVPSRNENLEEKMDCTSIRTVDSIVDNSVEKHSSTSSERVASINNISAKKRVCTGNETVDSTKDISTEKVPSTNSETLVSTKSNKSPQRSASACDKTVASINDNLTEKSACSNSETLAPISNNSREKHGCSSSRKDSTSNDISEEINPCTSIEIDALPKENLAESFEKNPVLTDTVIQDSSEVICHENAMNEDNPFTDTIAPLEASRDLPTQGITENSSNSATEKADLASITINADSVNEQENTQEVDACTSEDGTVTSEQMKLECGKVKTSEHEKFECEKVETENTNNECVNVTTNSEELKNECMNVTSDSGNADNEGATANPKCKDDISGNNDSTTIDTENDNMVLGEERQNNCDVKTDLLKDKDVKTDLVKDTDMKTDTLEKNDDKTNSLKNNAQREIPMETEETSNRLSSKRNCDRAVKVRGKEDIAMPVGREIKNGEAERMSNDTESTKEVGNKEKEVCEAPVEFTIGDIVWAQARGLPSWPGKIVDERDVGHGKAAADIGKKWVMWFGDHTFSQVEIEKLKTLTDGLKTLDDKGRKRKYRGKKTRIGLEQAISEALEELDKRERLRSRQGPKAKKRRL